MVRKKLFETMLLCFVLITTVLLAVPQISLADSPSKSAPVLPPGKPPFQSDETLKVQQAYVSVSNGVKGGAASFMYYNAENPYKSGTSAIGRAWTQTNQIPGCFKTGYAQAWLWRWNGSQWIIVASNRYDFYCPSICTAIALPTKSGAQTGYYCVTSRHEVWANLEPLHYAEDYSATVWLTY
jgi:hypothetical protein